MEESDKRESDKRESGKREREYNMIKKLVKIADNLDRAGLTSDADFITSIIMAYKKAQLGSLDGADLEGAGGVPEEIDIPEDEMALLREVFSALGESLGEGKNKEIS